jgi:peptide/nickel transport system substrate-binding protein
MSGDIVGNSSAISRRTLVGGAAVGALALAGTPLSTFLFGCKGATDEQIPATQGGETSGPVAGGSLTYALATEPETLDPHRSGMIVEERVFASLFERLFVNAEGGGLEPWLAEEWSLDEDGKSYVVRLREGVRFHDGTAFDAEALKYNFDRVLDPETQTTLSSLEPFTSLDILDEYNVRINLERPSAFFLTNLSQIGIVSPTAAKADRDQFGRNPVGTGPFVFDSWEEDIVVKRNPDYNWGPDSVSNKGPAYLDQITFKVVSEESTRVGSVLSEQIDLAESIPAQNYVELQNNPSVQVFRKTTEGLAQTLFFVAAHDPWSELKVRQAVVAGIDVKTIIQTVFSGTFEQAFSPLTPGFPFYNSSFDGIDRYDPEEARRLLDEEGWVPGSDGIREKDGKRLTLAYGLSSPEGNKGEDVALFIQNQLKEIGIEVNIEASADFFSKLLEGAYDFWGNSMVTVKPTISFKLFFSSTGMVGSVLGYNNAKIDEWLGQVDGELDDAKRNDLLIKTQAEIIEQSYLVPIYNAAYTVLGSASVQDFGLHVLGLPNYWDIWLSSE